MNIPAWARPYLYIVKDEIHAEFPHADRQLFANRLKQLRVGCQSITNWNPLSPDEMKEHFREYLICMFALGAIDQARASQQVEQGLPANDGKNRQHWIPECYLKEFAENKKLKKIDIGYFSDPRPELISLVGLKHPDFCESEQEKGLLYSPLFEIILSKIEGHYSDLDKSRPVSNLWEFIVLTSFFLIFQLRTKQQFLAGHPAWNIKEPLLLDVIPNRASKLECISYTIDGCVENKRILLPISQHPLLLEPRGNDTFNLWCIYTPTTLLALKDRDSEDIFDGNEIQKYLGLVIGNNDEKIFYYPPSALLLNPVWE